MASPQHINVSCSGVPVTGIMSNSLCNYVSVSARLSARLCGGISLCVFAFLYLATCVCALMRHRSWLPRLARPPVSRTCQISFLCSITQNKFDELEIAPAKPPSLSASCIQPLKLGAGHQIQFHIKFMTLDGAQTALDVAG